MSVTRSKNIIVKELEKWELQSQKMRTRSAIAHGKIKSQLAFLETVMNREESNKFSSYIGKFMIYIDSFLFINLDRIVTKISANLNGSVEGLTVDLEEWGSVEQFIRVKRKKSKKAERPAKIPRKEHVKTFLNDEAGKIINGDNPLQLSLLIDESCDEVSAGDKEESDNDTSSANSNISTASQDS